MVNCSFRILDERSPLSLPGRPVATVALVEEDGELLLPGAISNYRRISP